VERRPRHQTPCACDRRRAGVDAGDLGGAAHEIPRERAFAAPHVENRAAGAVLADDLDEREVPPVGERGREDAPRTWATRVQGLESLRGRAGHRGQRAIAEERLRERPDELDEAHRPTVRPRPIGIETPTEGRSARWVGPA
jgi:hypothetical protein